MKKFGLIGGIGPESTGRYYQEIVKKYRKRLKTDDYPDLLIRSINMTEMLSYVFADDLERLTHYLNQYLTELQSAGVDFSAFASNTPHLVFERLREVSRLPLISIVEETCKAVQSNGLEKVGLFGTKSTMEKGFYQSNAEKYGFKIITPGERQRNFIHEKYFEELVFNQIAPDTKSELINIIRNLQEKDEIQGIILGGTELSFILNQSDFADLTVFDTTQIHVEAIVAEMIAP